MVQNLRETVRDLRDFFAGVRILAKSGSWFFALYIVIEAIGGLTPAIIYSSLAVIIGQIGALESAPFVLNSGLVLAVGAICAVIIINEVFWAWQEYLRSVIEARFGTTITTRLLRALFGLSDMAQREEPELADQIQIAQSASSRLQPFINTLSNLWVWSTTAISCALLIGQISPWIALMIVLTSLPAMLVNWQRASRQNQAERSESNRLRQAGYSYDLAYSRAVGVEMRIFGFGAWLIQRQQALWQSAMQSVFREINKSMLYGFGLLALQIGIAISSLGWLLYLYRQGDLPIGGMTAAILAIVTLIETMLSLQQVPSQIRSSSLFLSALFLIEQRPQQASQARAQNSAQTDFQLRSGIRFENVTFSYPNRSDPVLRGLSLDIPAGQSLALVGENGMGKSTLLKLLCRFYEPDSGRILIDGHDIRSYDIELLRSKITTVFQDFIHYPTTLLENISLKPTVDPAERAHLSAAMAFAGVDSFLERLPKAEETLLVPDLGGVDLSGGQWQRIAIARAINKRMGNDAPIVIFDEPTSALDVRSEMEINQKLLQLTRGATTLIVSHRFATIRGADQIAVLKDGVIAEQGSHATLLGLNGIYAEWYAAQQKEDLDAAL
jgi:ATP-binding cassette subfamily B protein